MVKGAWQHENALAGAGGRVFLMTIVIKCSQKAP